MCVVRYLCTLYVPNCSVCNVSMAGHGLTVCRGLVSCLDRKHIDVAPYMTNRCVEMCTCFVCIGHCCSHHRLEVWILCDYVGGLAHCVLSQNGDWEQFPRKWVLAPQQGHSQHCVLVTEVIFTCHKLGCR